MTNIIGKFDSETGNEVRNFAHIPWEEYLASKKYDKNIDNMCTNCIKEQKAKYGKITVECSGPLTIDNMVPEEVRHVLSTEELQLLREAYNPYEWAENNIDVKNKDKKERLFSKRWYQNQYTNCSSKRKTIRSGRRIGKTFGVVLSLLHRMLTNNNYNILVVTPYDSQSEEVFTTMKKLLMNLEQPYESIVKRAKESPYYIELRNGSRMKAFTVGNSGGGQIRGQPADILYVDEADLLTQKDFNSILAIMLDKPDTEMWVSSTPDGERQMYKLSQDEAFKEFHFPSSVLPHYNDKIDRDLRNQSDEMGYVQEVLAEFGASRLGVFQKYYIDMCTKLDYTITQEDILARRGDFIITMGCDWNHDQIGTRICVLAYDKKNNVFSIAEKASVSKEGWTQTMAMEKIIQLNRKYRFEKIYIDEGYGATQAEMLKGFAIEQFGKLPNNHPDLYLSELRAINFSSKIEIKDPYTGLDSKKDIKPYMVETLNRLIEKMVLKLHTDEDKKLIDQLKGYEEKRGVTGRPTYYASNTAVGDHDLDALMLAALAYNLEFSEIFANLRTEIAIKVLSQEDIHGASTTHLRPSAAYAGNNNDGLEIRTRKRENCSPKSRVLYVGARRQDNNNDEDNGIMRTSSLLYGKGTLLKKKGKRAQF